MSLQQIHTSRFGEVSFEEEKLLTFISPVLGFEEYTQYIILDHAEDSPFKWLQSVENGDLAFVITNPKLFGIPYEFLLPEDVVEQLGVKQSEDVLVFTLVNIPNENPTLMTSNLLGPLVINQVNKKAMQWVLNDAASPYSTKTRLIPDTALQTSSSGSTTTGKGE